MSYHSTSKCRKNRPNAKGRNPTSRFTSLPHYLLECAAYRCLTPNARALLVELTMIDNGKNNGAIFLSIKDAADRIGVVNTTSVCGAFKELRECGFITMTKDAHFRVKASHKARARCWKLNWLPLPSLAAPTGECLSYEPPLRTHARKRMEAGQQALKRFRRVQAAGKSPVYDPYALIDLETSSTTRPVCKSTTAQSRNSRKQPIHSIHNLNTHSDAKGLGGHTCGWWTPTRLAAAQLAIGTVLAWRDSA